MEPTLRQDYFVISGILPVMGGRGRDYRNCVGLQELCEEAVGFVDMWASFVGRKDFFMRDWLLMTAKAQQFLGMGLSESLVSAEVSLII